MNPFINSVLYLSIFFLYWRLVRNVTVNLFILAIWVLAALLSMFMVSMPQFEESVLGGELILEPYLYLFFLFLIAFAPLCKFNESRLERIQMLSSTTTGYLILFYGLLSILCTCLYFQPMMQSIRAGLGANRTEVEITASTLTGNWLILVGVTIRSILDPLIYFLLFYVLSFQSRYKFRNWFLIFSIYIPNLVIALSLSARSDLIFCIMKTLIAFLFFRHYLSPKIKHRICFLFLVLAAVILPVFLAISAMRFSGTVFDGAYGYIRYGGECFTNFNIFAYNKIDQHHGGPELFPTLFRLSPHWTEQYANLTTPEKAEFMNSITGIPLKVAVFYTFIGDFYIAYGKISALLIIIGIAVTGIILIPGNGTLRIQDMIPLALYYELMARGVFFMPIRSFLGERMIIFYIILYIALSILYSKKRIEYVK